MAFITSAYSLEHHKTRQRNSCVGDDDEVSVEEEVIEVEPKEDRVGEEVVTFKQIKDHLDPISLNQKPNISNLDINSPKDPMELDENVFNEASNAVKSDTGSSETVTKSTPGSAEITLTEVIEITPLSKPNDAGRGEVGHRGGAGEAGGKEGGRGKGKR